MAKKVEFNAGVKKITSTLKRDEDGTPNLVTAIGFEGDEVTEDDVKALITMQRRGLLRVTVEAVQGELPLAR